MYSGTFIVLCFDLFFFVLCTPCCQFLWILHFLFALRYFPTLVVICTDCTSSLKSNYHTITTTKTTRCCADRAVLFLFLLCFVCFVLYYIVLFCFDLNYSALFCFGLFCIVLFCFLFCFCFCLLVCLLVGFLKFSVSGMVTLDAFSIVDYLH